MSGGWPVEGARVWRRGVLRAWAVAAAARSGLRMMLGGSLRGAAVWPPPRAAAVNCEPGVVSRVC